jgi:hypothetical protein
VAAYWYHVWIVTVQLAPWFLGGLLVAGLLHVLLPDKFVARHLGRSGLGSVIKASVLGVPLPLCSCGVIPTALGLKKDGASDGAAVGFLISTPQTGVDSIFVSAALLGWPFALFKVGSALVTGLVGGTLTFLTDRKVSEVDSGIGAEGNSRDSAWKRFFDYTLDDLFAMVWGWLVVGIFVSAAITTWLPEDAFSGTLLGGGFLSLLFVLVVSLPLYVCATSSVPIVAALVTSGMPLGGALVFLMAGPASNVATVGAVYRGFGKRVLGIYLATITVGSLGFGYLFDFVLADRFTSHTSMHGHGEGRWAQGTSVLFVLLVLRFAWRDLGVWLKNRRAQWEETESMTLEVGGMRCAACAKKVETKIRSFPAVGSVTVNLESGSTRIGGRQLPRADIEGALREAGFEVGSDFEEPSA